MSQFTNSKACKQYGLEARCRMRPGWKADRWSAEWDEYLDGVVRTAITNGIRSAPTKGSTIYPPVRTTKEMI